MEENKKESSLTKKNINNEVEYETKIYKNNNEEIEDTTQYGEFISSYFAWLTPEKQKRRAKEIDNMTK